MEETAERDADEVDFATAEALGDMRCPYGSEGDAEDVECEERDWLQGEIGLGNIGVEIEAFDDLGQAGCVGCEAVSTGKWSVMSALGYLLTTWSIIVG